MPTNFTDIQSENNAGTYDIVITDSDGTMVTTSLYTQLVDTVEDRNTWIEF